MSKYKADWQMWKIEAIDGHEARAAFIEGWMSRPGAIIDRCDEFFRILNGRQNQRAAKVVPFTRKERAAGEKESEQEEAPF